LGGAKRFWVIFVKFGERIERKLEAARNARNVEGFEGVFESVIQFLKGYKDKPITSLSYILGSNFLRFWGCLYILLVSGKRSNLFAGLEETFISFK
jgi:hypothetical protein